MQKYQGVLRRFLREEERLILSKETEMPLVIEANGASDLAFLHAFLAKNSEQIIQDMAQYGAVLLRGFEVETDAQFEQTVLSIPQFRGIQHAFMSENGRDHVDNLQFVLHTNSIYKTGGTVYLGGFHTENYYSADVPSFLSFYCFEPSTLGGETGLINTEKIYSHLKNALQEKLEKNAFFVSKWLLSEISAQYGIEREHVKQICEQFDLPLQGEGDTECVLMYKPSVLEHPLTKKKALQINLFELATLNNALRNCFMQDYQGKEWFWHRFFWKMPGFLFNSLEQISVMAIAFKHSPKKALKIGYNTLKKLKISKKNKHKIRSAETIKVGSCFQNEDIQELAKLMRDYYSSCLWKKGDIILIDNKKVMHAGMPGKGPRLIRAMICNPIEMQYAAKGPGCIKAKERDTDTIGAYMAKKDL